MSYTSYDFPHTHYYDSDLRELLHKVKTLEEAYEVLDNWIKEVDPKIEDILKMWSLIESGDLPPAVIDAIKQWMSKNAIDLIGQLVKSVFFGITDDGHFVAYIPDSWSDIIFNTTYYDIILESHPEYGYGHLVLSY